MRTAAGVALVVLAAVALAGCARDGAGGVTTVAVTETATATATATVVATVTAAPAASVPGLPSDVTGVWCSDLDPTQCVDFGQIVADHPKAFVKETKADADTPGATRILLCLEPDAAGTDCLDFADSLLLELLPTGVAWNCEAVAKTWGTKGFADCDPDYSSVHDTSRARLLNLPFDQQGTTFEDVPPLYQVSG